MSSLEVLNDEYKLLKEIFEGKLEDIDIKIYRLLRNNGRLTDTELAEKLGVSITTARRRRLELQQKNYLQIIGILYFGSIKIAYADVIVHLDHSSTTEDIQRFIEDCVKSPYIYEVTEYIGNSLLLRFYEKDLEKLNSAIQKFMEGKNIVSEYKIMVATTTPKAWNKILLEKK